MGGGGGGFLRREASGRCILIRRYLGVCEVMRYRAERLGRQCLLSNLKNRGGGARGVKVYISRG